MTTGIGSALVRCGAVHRRSPTTRRRKARVTSTQDDGRGDLAHAVAVAEVGDDCPAEEQQQSRGGQGTDHRDERADEQPEDGEDLEQADPPVRRDAEADVFGLGAHGGYGGELGRAEGREGDDQEARKNRCWCS